MQLTQKVHQQLAEQLTAGDLVIDATAGNGHDTQYLAEIVGPQGQVIAIDIQQAAIDSTRAKLEHAQLSQRVHLIQGDHAAQLQALSQQHSGQVASILFNLGYLPGSDKRVQTQSTSTAKALTASLELLAPGALLSVTAYRGHPGGMEEAQVVADWMQTQQSAGHAVEYHQPASKNTPPVLWLLWKKA